MIFCKTFRETETTNNPLIFVEWTDGQRTNNFQATKIFLTCFRMRMKVLVKLKSYEWKTYSQQSSETNC